MDLTWECYGRVNLVDSEMLCALKKAGCMTILYGIESGSQKVLNYMNKNITLEQIYRAIALTKQAGLNVDGAWMIGFPIESKKEIMETLAFCKNLKLDHYDVFSILTPFPGSEFYKEMKEEGLLLSEDWSLFFNRRFEEDNVLIKTRYLSNEELRNLYKYVNKKIIQYNFYRKIKYCLEHPYLAIKYLSNNSKFTKIWVKKAFKSFKH